MADGMERRDFLKVLGVAGAGAALTGCNTEPVARLIPYVVQPADIVPGNATWYRTTCRECPAGCGMEVRTREGRALKTEGNPLSPISHGNLCARGQASLNGLYDPDRIPQALARNGDSWSKLTWDDAEQRVVSALARGPAVFVTGGVTGTMDRLLDDWCRAMGVERVRFEAFAFEPLRAASRMLYGIDGIPVHDFEQADVVVSFGADFMETWLSPIDYAHGYVEAHAFDRGRRGRFIAVTPHQSLTDLNADDWLPAVPGTEHLVALAMARLVAESTGQRGAVMGLLEDVDVDAAARAAGIDADRIRAVAKLFARDGRSLAVGPGVASDHSAATEVAVAVGLLNHVAGNVGSTVRFERREQGVPASSYADWRSLIQQIRNSEISSLLFYGANPLYSVPGEEDVAEVLGSVDFVASFATFLDETAALANVLLPDHHFLEQWGDHEPRSGVYSLVQPVMTPVFDTKQTGDVLLSMAKRAGKPLNTQANTFYDYLRERWRGEIQPRVGQTNTHFEDWWIQSLEAGVVVEKAPTSRPPTLKVTELGALDLSSPAPFGGADDAEFYLVVYPSYRFYDGRMGNRMWLQELPDPVSKITWQSWVEVHPSVADEMGLDNGAVVKVETPSGTVELPVWKHPGMRRDVIAIQLGQGHGHMGRYARDRGVNAASLLKPLVEEHSGGPVWQQAKASLRSQGRWERLAILTDRYTTTDREQVVETLSLDDARRAEPVQDLVSVIAGVATQATQRAQNAAAGKPPGQVPAGHAEESEHPLKQKVRTLQTDGGFQPTDVDAGPQAYPPPGTHYGEYTELQPRWAMTIDMERCIGCSACVTACQAENNIAVVGPELIKDRRNIQWLRIERYFQVGETGGQTGGEGPYKGTTFLPMLCQQCGNAPCEPVCPVYAAYHTPDGLNAQVYNRCVGTRYCANNCPYKVRYFNWFTYDWPEPLNWQLNPDITVREKGIMEKCTFCVQRIRDREHKARLADRPVRDGEIVPACAQTCPGQAIVFGNIKDPNSRVAQVAASGRGYRVLDELNTQSAITYLKRVVADEAEV
ncbi:MAG: 4Fe-4S dicluster domain-containing protein [Gemmatimonadota bacterium]